MSVNAASQSFEFVFYSKLFFFQRGDPDFIPIGARHLIVYAFFQFLVFFGQFLDMPLQCHACTSLS